MSDHKLTVTDTGIYTYEVRTTKYIGIIRERLDDGVQEAIQSMLRDLSRAYNRSSLLSKNDLLDLIYEGFQKLSQVRQSYDYPTVEKRPVEEIENKVNEEETEERTWGMSPDLHRRLQHLISVLGKFIHSPRKYKKEVMLSIIDECLEDVYHYNYDANDKVAIFLHHEVESAGEYLSVSENTQLHLARTCADAARKRLLLVNSSTRKEDILKHVEYALDRLENI